MTTKGAPFCKSLVAPNAAPAIPMLLFEGMLIRRTTEERFSNRSMGGAPTTARVPESQVSVVLNVKYNTG